MCKLLYIFLLLVLLVSEKKAEKQLCSLQKSGDFCICKHMTQRNSILMVADCARINIQHFPNQEQFENDLDVLDLSHNELVRLTTEETSFSSATLQTLLLSYNQILEISTDFFKDIPNLVKLDLSYNALTELNNVELFQNLPHLQYLDLSFNDIKTLQENLFLPLTQLKYFDLSYNDPAVGKILTKNSSLSTQLGLNSNLTTLRLNNLGLIDLHNVYFVNYTNLKHLSLADNHFTQLPHIPSSVEYIDLSGSNLAIIQAKMLSFYAVKTLKMDRMIKLESIHHYAFYGLQALEELSIRNCRNLKEFNEMIFGSLYKNMNVSLKRLYISGNAIESLNSSYKYLFKNLETIDLTDNPWKCDCNLLWLLEFNNLYKSENIRCSSPMRVAYKELIDIEDRDLPSCYPEKYGKKSHRILITILAVCIIVLAALVAYLIYYSPKFISNRNLGPSSPYTACARS